MPSESTYVAWVYCENCGSNHMQYIKQGKNLSAEPCDKCEVTMLIPNRTSPKKHGYRKDKHVGWISW